MGGVGQELIKAIYLVWSNGLDHSCDPRCDKQSILHPGSGEEVEASSSAGLHCGCAAHLSPGNRGKRPLGDCTMVVVPACNLATGALNEDPRPRKAPILCFDRCFITGCKTNRAKSSRRTKS